MVIRLPDKSKLLLPIPYMNEALTNILHVYYYHDYDIIKDFVPRKGWKVIDIGGFIGIWSIYVASKVSHQGYIIYVEPIPEHVKWAIRSFNINNFKNVLVVPRAIKINGEELEIYISKRSLNSSSLREYAEYMGEGIKGRIKVKTIALRNLVKILTTVDLIKIDIEGRELDLLKASGEILEKKSFIKRLVIEVHPPFVSTREIVNLLENYNYNVWIYDPGLEHQLFVYAHKNDTD